MTHAVMVAEAPIMCTACQSNVVTRHHTYHTNITVERVFFSEAQIIHTNTSALVLAPCLFSKLKAKKGKTPKAG